MLMPASATSIGRFRILKTLGRGAQGEVFLAEDTRPKRKVAIKTLQVSGRTAEERHAQVKALLEEATIVSQLAHPNIVPLFDAGEEQGVPYLVFEYVEGRTLQAQIRDMGPLPPAKAVDYTIQMLKAMGYAHQKGIVHRDLKPANLMLQEDVLRVMDFGVAQLISQELDDDEAFTGTPTTTTAPHMMEVYEVLWQWGEQTTIFDKHPANAPRVAANLQIMHDGKVFTVNSGSPSCRIGRDRTSDIIVAVARASRAHAHVEFRKDKFYIVDHSSNGTFVRFDSEDEVRLSREEIILRRSGIMSFGETTATSQGTVRFELF